MKITIPEFSFVVLVGATSSGKSTFARRHFLPTEIISSDFCRGLVSDDENSMEATKPAFEVLHFIAAKRLLAGRLTVIDATSLQRESRAPLVHLARQFHCLPVAIVLNLPEGVLQERNRERLDRNLGQHVIRQHISQLRRSLRELKREGFRYVYVINSVEELDDVMVERQPLWTNKRAEHGPFDIIGDVHGCFDELVELLGRLGYSIESTADDESGAAGYNVTPPEGRKAVFLGDLVDRGPKIPDVLRLVMSMTQAGTALCVPGNHDMKLMKHLNGSKVQIKHGLENSVAQLEAEPEAFRRRVGAFLDGLISHYVLDDGKLVVAHAGMREEMQGRGSGRVRDFALYGETTGETDEFGLPVRYNWAAEYRGRAMVVYGHTPVPEPEWLNNTINIDTGCVFGGSLTALRYPERELVSVPAAQVYCESTKPFLPAPDDLSAQQAHDEVLRLEDFIGKRLIATRLLRQVTIREENGSAAIEAMSRFAVNPKWLIYLPPTMSPSGTSQREGLLEHPAEALEYYRGQGVAQVVCEEKHMGSRAVVIICRDGAAARKTFGVGESEGVGVVYTRTGRRFFGDDKLEAEFLARLRGAMDAAQFWQEFETEWACLDCELMPWSVKAQELIQRQYAAVGAASRMALGDVVEALRKGSERYPELAPLLEKHQLKQSLAGRYSEAYRQYCWPVQTIDDLRLAPFHLLATEGRAHIDKDHVWHMETLARICEHDTRVLLKSRYRVIDLASEESIGEGIGWWEELTAGGGEGMVVKPRDFIHIGPKGPIQPAIKCRGPEYLRIIYGPEYSLPENLERLRQRGLGAKRSLALREFALGIEGLERFVKGDALRRVHECCLGVLALESEPVDPRL